MNEETTNKLTKASSSLKEKLDDLGEKIKANWESFRDAAQHDEFLKDLGRCAGYNEAVQDMVKFVAKESGDGVRGFALGLEKGEAGRPELADFGGPIEPETWGFDFGLWVRSQVPALIALVLGSLKENWGELLKR